MTFCYSTDGEIYREDEDYVIADIIEAQSTPQDSVGCSYYKGIAIKPHPSEMFNVDWLIEDMQERAYDEYGEYSEDFLTDLSTDQVKEFEALVNDWLDKNIAVNFYKVQDSHEVSITQEMVDEYLEGLEC